MTREKQFEDWVNEFYELTRKIQGGDDSLRKKRKRLKAKIGIYFGDLLDEWKANGKKFKSERKVVANPRKPRRPLSDAEKKVWIEEQRIAKHNKGILLARYWYESWVREQKYEEMRRNGELTCGTLVYNLPYNAYRERDEIIEVTEKLGGKHASSDYSYPKSWECWVG